MAVNPNGLNNDNKIDRDQILLGAVRNFVGFMRSRNYKQCDYWLNFIRDFFPTIKLDDLKYEGKPLFEVVLEEGSKGTLAVLLKQGFAFSEKAKEHPVLIIELLFHLIQINEIKTFEQTLDWAKDNIEGFTVNAHSDLYDMNLFQYAVIFGELEFVEELLADDRVDLTVKLQNGTPNGANVLDLCLREVAFKMNDKQYKTNPDKTIARRLLKRIKTLREQGNSILPIVDSIERLALLVTESQKLGYIKAIARLESIITLIEQHEIPKDKHKDPRAGVREGEERKARRDHYGPQAQKRMVAPSPSPSPVAAAMAAAVPMSLAPVSVPMFKAASRPGLAAAAVAPKPGLAAVPAPAAIARQPGLAASPASTPVARQPRLAAALTLAPVARPASTPAPTPGRAAAPIGLPVEIKGIDEKSKLDGIVSSITRIVNTYLTKDRNSIEKNILLSIDTEIRGILTQIESLQEKELGQLIRRLKSENLIGVVFQLIIEHRKLPLLQVLLMYGIDVNTKLFNNYSPIAFAVVDFYDRVSYSIEDQKELFDIMMLLIQRGANLKSEINPNIKSASVFCILVKRIRMSAVNFPAFSPEFKRGWKRLKYIMFAALRADIRNYYKDDERNLAVTVSDLTLHPRHADRLVIDGSPVEFEYFQPGTVGEELIDSYNEFIQDPRFTPYLIQIQNAILSKAGIVSTENTTNPIGERLLVNPISANVSSFGKIEHHKEMEEALKKKGGVSVIPTVVKMKADIFHAVTYLFHETFCVRVNCGDTSGAVENTTGGILVYRIVHPDVLIKDWQGKFLNSINNPIYDEDLNTHFLSECGGSAKPIYKIKKEMQRAANCSWKSSEAAVHAIIFLNLFKFFKEYYKGESNKSDSKDQSEHDAICFRLAEGYSTMWFNLFVVYDRIRSFEQCNDPEVARHVPPELFERRNYNFIQALDNFESSVKAMGLPIVLDLNKDGFLEKLGIDFKGHAEKRAIRLKM